MKRILTILLLLNYVTIGNSQTIIDSHKESNINQHLSLGDSKTEPKIEGWNWKSLMKPNVEPVHIINEIRSSRAIKLGLDSVVNGYSKNEYQYDIYGNNNGGIQYQKAFNQTAWRPISKFNSVFDFYGSITDLEYYNWSETNSIWVGVAKDNIQYDANRNNWKIVHYLWDQPNSVWVLFSRVIKKFNSDNQVIESISEWKDLNTGVIKPTSKSETFYDSQGIDTLKLNSVWDTISNEWQPHNKSIKKMNSDNLLVEEASYKFNKQLNIWIGENRETYFYYFNKKIHRKTFFVWDSNNQQWLNDTEFKYEYDLNLHRIKELRSKWNTGNSQWKEFNKIIWNNDPSGNILLCSKYTWDNTYWKKYEETEKTYDVNNNVTYEFVRMYIPASNQLDNYYKVYRIFDTDGNLTENELWSWNPYTGVWLRFRKDLYEYDSNGNKVKIILQYADSTLTQWENNSKSDMFYDSQNHVIASEQSMWDTNGLNIWVPEELFEWKYDTTYNLSDLIVPNEYQYDGKITEIKKYLMNPFTLAWYEIESQKYYFSSYTIDGIIETNSRELEIYPNPANDFVIVSGFEKSTLFKIYDISGKLVQNGSIDNRGLISVSGLSTGIYVIQVEDKRSKLVVK